WDRRFFIEIRGGKKAKTGLFAAPLGGEGLGRLERAGLQVPKAVPRCYLHVLPAVFNFNGLVSCPVLSEQNKVKMVPWQPETPYLPEINGKAGW
ncbi:MAG: hypothetical protein VX296_00420, partial [Pseudomonadota bacterium]|nr:hypothetical protein [Pseudomonadota bacterium]